MPETGVRALVTGRATARLHTLKLAGNPIGDAGNVRPDYANGLDPSGGILYSVRTFNQDSSLVTAPGWDDVTGNGVPTPKFISAFNAG